LRTLWLAVQCWKFGFRKLETALPVYALLSSLTRVWRALRPPPPPQRITKLVSWQVRRKKNIVFNGDRNHNTASVYYIIIIIIVTYSDSDLCQKILCSGFSLTVPHNRLYRRCTTTTTLIVFKDWKTHKYLVNFGKRLPLINL